MAIDWTELTPTEFEELCYLLLEANGFQELRWYGKGGGDKGRDITAIKETSFTNSLKNKERWIIQCKRFTSQPPGIDLIASFFEKCREHKPDNVLLIISNTLSSDTKDWIEGIRSEYRFRIHLWEEMDLVTEMKSHRGALQPKALDLLVESFLSQDEPALFGRIRMSPIYYISNIKGLEEIGIFLLNDYGHSQNIRWINQFIEYIRRHDIIFESYNQEDE